MMRRLLYTVTILLLALTLRAQDAQFTCSVDRVEVPLGQQFQVTYTLSGGNLKRHSGFNAPDLNRNFLTLSGPSTSQQMQIINGRVSSSMSWTYVVQARGTGAFTVPAATIEYDGNTLQTNTVRIKVTKAVPKSTQQSGDTRGESEAIDKEIAENLFIRAIANRTEVYLGEPITVTFKLYSRVAFQLENPIKLPRMVGFWSEDIESPTQLRPKIEVYRGRQFETFMLRKVLYFPTQAGKLSIEPFEINTTVRVRKRRRNTGNSAFDRFFSDPFFDNYDNVKKTLLTQKVNVNVRPLPEEGKPPGFSGVVGSYDMETSLDRSELRANETATLTVTLQGEGNIRLLDEANITFPAGVDHYDPTISENVRYEQGTMAGSKSFEYILVPRYAGKVTIPSITLDYFDPVDRTYKKLSSEPYSLTIAEGDERQKADGVERERVDYLAMDVKPLREDPTSVLATEDPAVGPVSMLLFYLLPFVALAGGLVWKQRYDRMHGDVAGLKRRRATRIAEKHLSNAHNFLEKGDTDAYYLEIARALWGYVQDKLGLPTSETAVSSVAGRLEKDGAGQELVLKIRDALEAVEYARFSPTRASQEEMQALYETAREGIVAMEESLRENA
ncbi:MAG: hypothetical protein C0600_02460 [Ignavibacteria bacterium]|nr:MAG: hypothetical protein C0600_02460 [Ignavibacteria bacterium]